MAPASKPNPITREETLTQPGDGWITVSEGSRTRITFDEIGDTFTGFYEGEETIINPNDGTEMNYFNFSAYQVGDSNPGIDNGEKCAVSRSNGLEKAMQSVPRGNLTFLQLHKLIPSNRGNDYKDYIVRHMAPPRGA